jgi:hypothetical protein
MADAGPAIEVRGLCKSRPRNGKPGQVYGALASSQPDVPAEVVHRDFGRCGRTSPAQVNTRGVGNDTGRTRRKS